MNPKHILLKNSDLINDFIVKKSEEQIKQKRNLSDEEFIKILIFTR